VAQLPFLAELVALAEVLVELLLFKVARVFLVMVVPSLFKVALQMAALVEQLQFLVEQVLAEQVLAEI
jgi:hypothetical protein